jgi:two-component system NtrC family response regulator
LFEVANGGTIFLDEIGELPKAMQAKLLRVLESGEIRRVGENASVTVDVRVVCATLRDVEQMVVDGDFREDLLFRINTFEIHIPPLRDRVDDVADLALCLLKRVRPGVRDGDTVFTDETIEALERHVWPGNVRELANVVEHAAILCDDGELIAPEHLPRNLDHRRLRAVHPQFTAGQSLREIEMQAIYQALDRHAGSKPTAAKELGISLKTLYNKLSHAGDLERSA